MATSPLCTSDSRARRRTRKRLVCVQSAALLFAVIVTGVTAVHEPMFDGRYRWYAGALTVLVAQLALITGFLCHRAGRRRAEVALQASESALRLSDEKARTLAGRLIAAQEQERARIARELHDDLSQKLALLSIELDHLVGQSEGSDGLIRRVRAAAISVGDIATDVHNLSHELHPARLELLGLEPALRSLCRDMSSAHNLRIDFEHGPIPGSTPNEAVLCLFRVTQEALRNVVKHSATSVAQVRLSHAAGMLELHIADSGRGFTPRPSDGLGLVSMRERVHFLGGHIAVQSIPGGGTRIDVSVPVRSEPQKGPLVARSDDATDAHRRSSAFARLRRGLARRRHHDGFHDGNRGRGYRVSASNGG